MLEPHAKTSWISEYLVKHLHLKLERNQIVFWHITTLLPLVWPQKLSSLSYLGTKIKHTQSTPLYFSSNKLKSILNFKIRSFLQRILCFQLHFWIPHPQKWLGTNFYEICSFHWENITLLVMAGNSKWWLYPSIKSIWANFQTVIILQHNIVTGWNFADFLFLMGPIATPNLEEIWNGGCQT